jgi:hypothetical protein
MNIKIVRVNWSWPLVSKRAYTLLEEQLARVQAERDEYRTRGDRLYDETIIRFGYEPAAPQVRAENKAAVEEYQREQHIDDPFGGGLDEEIEAIADEIVSRNETTAKN